MTDMIIADSNLSKIKPKLRTTGIISGNFGKPKVKAGSTLNEIGMTKSDKVHVTTQNDYLQRMYDAFDKTEDPKLKEFIYQEIRKILVQRNLWK